MIISKRKMSVLMSLVLVFGNFTAVYAGDNEDGIIDTTAVSNMSDDVNENAEKETVIFKDQSGKIIGSMEKTMGEEFVLPEIFVSDDGTKYQLADSVAQVASLDEEDNFVTYYEIFEVTYLAVDGETVIATEEYPYGTVINPWSEAQAKANGAKTYYQEPIYNENGEYTGVSKNCFAGWVIKLEDGKYDWTVYKSSSKVTVDGDMDFKAKYSTWSEGVYYYILNRDEDRPSDLGGRPTEEYSAGIAGTLKVPQSTIDLNTVVELLGVQPTEEQIEAVCDIDFEKEYVEWYVVKYHSGNGWHIDGEILEKPTVTVKFVRSDALIENNYVSLKDSEFYVCDAGSTFELSDMVSVPMEIEKDGEVFELTNVKEQLMQTVENGRTGNTDLYVYYDLKVVTEEETTTEEQTTEEITTEEQTTEEITTEEQTTEEITTEEQTTEEITTEEQTTEEITTEEQTTEEVIIDEEVPPMVKPEETTEEEVIIEDDEIPQVEPEITTETEPDEVIDIEEEDTPTTGDSVSKAVFITLAIAALAVVAAVFGKKKTDME